MLFENILNSEETNEIDVSKKVQATLNNYLWMLEDEIYFFTQPGVMNLTFPCTTTLGGITPGRPCVFPVTWIYWYGYGGNDTFTGCISPHDFGASKPGCFTRVFENRTVNSNNETDIYWGYCPGSCKGESPSPTSPYNLAKSKYTNLWKADLYDLDPWSSSYCQTYDPPIKTKPDLLNRIYFLLQKPKPEREYDSSYDIFIHQKGQFWPRSDMGSFGQPDAVTVAQSTHRGIDDLELYFSVKEISRINSQENPCNENEQYSLTVCLHDYAYRQSGCRINIFGTLQKRKEFCTQEGFKVYIETLQYLKQEDIQKIEKVSGCKRKCKTFAYHYEKNLQKSEGENNNRSEVFIQAKSSVVTYLTEHYTFDINDFISSVGGNLGLFLGWSFLTIFETLEFICVNIITKFKIWSLRRGEVSAING